jgi:(E)-4-hydroxy-3-methylbut-2-enyl-diphosphate synthase
MLAAYRSLAAEVDYPLHLGVTEAGTVNSGTIKSAVGIGALLAEGIGDTIRVSLTGDPLPEIRVAYEILKALNLRQRGAEIISCPTCGRTRINLSQLADKVEAKLQTVDKPIKVAVMGCVVNGPGEAREADIGIAGGNGQGLIFKKGEIIARVPEDQLLDMLFKEIDQMCN